MTQNSQNTPSPTVVTPPKADVRDIPLSNIIANKANNFRTVMDEEAVKELAETMKSQGQLQAVGVAPRKDGKWELLYGFRRFASAQLLGWSTIKADVRTDSDPIRNKFDNLAENLARENLTPYDQAVAFASLKKEYNISGSDIAKRTGKGTSYINNLVRIVEGSEPVIMERWKMEQSPSFGKDKDGKRIPTMHQVCTTDWLVKLVASVPRTGQENHLKQALGLVTDEKEDTGSGGGKEESEPAGSTSVRRATMSTLNKAIEELTKKKTETKDKEAKADLDMVLATLKFAAGQAVDIKVGKNVIWAVTVPAKAE